MSERLAAFQWSTRAAAITVSSFLCVLAAQAEEQRCAELGANCICSEPLNTTTFTGGPPSWNPADSTTKQCSAEGVAGGAIARNTRDLAGSSDATALAALPAGHSVSHFLRAGDGHSGIFFVGNGGGVSSSFVRLAARWYIWYTPVFDFKAEGSCENSKIAELNNNARIDYTVGFHTYNYLEFSPSIDCCVSGPGPSHSLPSSQLKGKWWRYEVVMTNRSGPNFGLQMYGKNVTDDGPELTIIDLSVDKRVSNLTPPSLMSAILVNNYRQGTCRGWLGISHYMTAGWTTNAGQRIGPAAEIESPGSIPPPTNLRLGGLFREFRALALSQAPSQAIAMTAPSRISTIAWGRPLTPVLPLK